MKILILASGKGTNAANIIKLAKQGYFKNPEILAVISDNQNAHALEMAAKNSVRAIWLDSGKKGAFFSPEGAALYVKTVQELNPDLIVLAGFMKILPKTFTEKFPDKIINLHPSLLPAFMGEKNAIKSAFEYGVKISGVTVHFVNDILDGGKIIGQKAVEISPNDTLESFEAKIHAAEYELLPEVIRSFEK